MLQQIVYQSNITANIVYYYSYYNYISKIAIVQSMLPIQECERKKLKAVSLFFSNECTVIDHKLKYTEIGNLLFSFFKQSLLRVYSFLYKKQTHFIMKKFG
jgi:hypothetical protein